MLLPVPFKVGRWRVCVEGGSAAAAPVLAAVAPPSHARTRRASQHSKHTDGQRCLQ